MPLGYLTKTVGYYPDAFSQISTNDCQVSFHKELPSKPLDLEKQNENC